MQNITLEQLYFNRFFDRIFIKQKTVNPKMNAQDTARNIQPPTFI